jgi:hypothetical protein
MRRAKNELNQFFERWQEHWNLTFAEQVNLLADEIASLSHHRIRADREVEENVKIIADDMRQAVSKPLGQAHLTEEVSVTVAPRAKCVGLMNEVQLDRWKVWGVIPPKCCERAGDHNGYGTDGKLTFHCEASCSCHD